MRPSFLDDMGWAMGEVYGAVTDRILINLAHYFPYLKPGEKIPGSFEYQARMLAQMGQVNRETAAIIMQSLGGADEALFNVLSEAIKEGLKNEEPKLRKAAEKGLLNGEGFVPPEVTPNQMQAFQSYYRQAADKLNLVNTVMLESTQQAYLATVADMANKITATQGILNVAAGEVVTGVSTFNQALHSAVGKMVQNGLTGFVDHAGHNWSPEAYVAMDIRTTVANTARDAVFERNQEYGNDLYQVSTHDGARPLCYPWQGKVISTSGRRGTTEDLDGNQITIHSEDEIESFRYGGGLFGVNCGHYPMVFIPGFSTIKGKPQSEEENAKAYQESQQQRALERKVRAEKRDLEVLKAQGASEDQIKAQREKVRQASQNVQDFCDKTGRARHRDREYAPVNTKFPNPDTYNAASFPTQERDKILDTLRGQRQGMAQPTPAQTETIETNANGKAYTQAEKDAVEYYVSGDGMWVNQYLRDPSGYVQENGALTGEDRQFIKALDSATKKENVTDKLLYRSVDAQAVFGKMTDMDFDNLRNAVVYGDTSRPAQAALNKASGKIGTRVNEKGFMSTTRDAETAYAWNGYTGSTKDITLEMNVPDGIKGFDVEKMFEVEEMQQHEVLLQRDLTYKVEGIERRDSEDGSVIVVKASILKP